MMIYQKLLFQTIKVEKSAKFKIITAYLARKNFFSKILQNFDANQDLAPILNI